jgi:hypothetical protein
MNKALSEPIYPAFLSDSMRKKFIESQSGREILKEPCGSRDIAENIHYLYKVLGRSKISHNSPVMNIAMSNNKELRFICWCRWYVYINITITILDIIHRK